MEYFPRNVLIAFIFTIVAAAVFMFTRKPSIKKLVTFFAAAFLAALYVCMACNILFSVTRFGIYGDTRPYSGNYVPFRTIMAYAKRGNILLFVTQIIGNILVILPLPLVVWFCSRKRNMKRVCLVSLIITAAIEPLQLLINIYLGGPTNIIDIDDLILNLVGCTLGLLLLRAVKHTRLNT